MKDAASGRTDPFTSGEACPILIKQLERRWGVSLVSMLPPDAQSFCVDLQRRIAGALEDGGDRESGPSCTYVDFYEGGQLHTTHRTFVRSRASGPIRSSEFVRPGHGLESLHSILGSVVAELVPFRVAFTGLRMSPDGVGVILIGGCVGEASERDRRTLLGKLNARLPNHFKDTPRDWDTDPSKYHSIHTAIGYLKRPTPEGYERTTERMLACWGKPFEFTLLTMMVVHHRYRSLIPPHEGHATFLIGEHGAMDGATFVKNLNLI